MQKKSEQAKLVPTWRAWRDSTRLRSPTSGFGNKLPCHLSTAAQPCAFAASATGGAQARFPLPKGSGIQILFKSTKHRKRHPPNVDAFFYVACLEGFEPPTLWFVAKYSIQLSYKHVLLSFVCSNPGFYPFAVPEDSMPTHLAFRPLHNPVPSLYPPQAAVRLGSPDPLVRSQIL